jgi:hypothetical protein
MKTINKPIGTKPKHLKTHLIERNWVKCTDKRAKWVTSIIQHVTCKNCLKAIDKGKWVVKNPNFQRGIK